MFKDLSRTVARVDPPNAPMLIIPINAVANFGKSYYVAKRNDSQLPRIAVSSNVAMLLPALFPRGCGDYSALRPRCSSRNSANQLWCEFRRGRIARQVALIGIARGLLVKRLKIHQYEKWCFVVIWSNSSGIRWQSFEDSFLSIIRTVAFLKCVTNKANQI
jgi:hypothetical protein